MIDSMLARYATQRLYTKHAVCIFNDFLVNFLTSDPVETDIVIKRRIFNDYVGFSTIKKPP